MNPNMTPQQLASQHFLDTSPSLTAPQTTSSQPNFIEKLLPTAGSVLGGLVGSVGDLAGPLGVATTIGGSALGSSLGQELENALTGRHDSALTAGLEGAAGGALGAGANAVLGVGGKLLGDVAENAAVKGAEAAANTPWQGIAGTVAAKNGALGPTLEKMASYGIDTTPEGLARVTPNITGDDGAVLSDLVRGAMAKSTNPVDLTGTVNLANNIAASPELAAEGPTVGKAFTNTINNVLGLGQNGSLTNSAAGDIYQARQLLMNKAYGKGTSDALSSAYHDVAQSLDDALTHSGVDNALLENGITPEQFQQLHEISPQLAQEAVTAASKNVGALRSLQQPFVNASNLAKAAQNYANGQLPGALDTAAAEAAAKATGNVIPEGVQQAASVIHPLAGKATGILGNALPATAGLTSKLASKVPTSLLPLLSQIATHAPSMGADGAAPADGTGMGAGLPTNGDNSPVNYETTPLNAADLGQQINMAGLFNKDALPFYQAAQKAQAAQPALTGLEDAYAKAGGGQGLGNGLLAQLSSYVPGTDAYQYHQQMAGLASALSQATGESPAAIMAKLPSLMSDPAGAEAIFKTLQGSLDTMGAAATGGATNFSGVANATPSSSILAGL